MNMNLYINLRRLEELLIFSSSFLLLLFSVSSGKLDLSLCVELNNFFLRRIKNDLLNEFCMAFKWQLVKVWICCS